MSIVLTINDFNQAIDKIKIEQVQLKQQEYFLLGTFLRTPGLTLFSYNINTNEIKEVIIKYSDTINLVPIDGKLIPIDFENQRCLVDSRYEYFESLNIDNAQKRVKKWKDGKIKELFNLKKPSEDGIKFY
jgi:hypothetical protein